MEQEYQQQIQFPDARQSASLPAESEFHVSEETPLASRSLEASRARARLVQRAKSRSRLNGKIVLAASVVLLVLFASVQIFLRSNNEMVAGFLPLFFAAFLAASSLIAGLLLRWEQREKGKVLQEGAPIFESEGPENIGPLIDLLHFDDTKMNSLIRSKLIHLLPQVSASDAGLLTEAQRSRLNNILNIDPAWIAFHDLKDLRNPPIEREVQLRIAILKAYEQIGDERCLWIVEKLAYQNGDDAAHQSIRQAAQDCLPFVRTRTYQKDADMTLLRPSAFSSAGTEHLLRPLSSAPPASPHELLRPHIPD